MIMPSTQNAVNNHEYRSVPITALAESATNPRKRFDPKSLEEFAAYVSGHISGFFVSLAVLCPKTANSVSSLLMPSLKGT
jgi:hypothetical protein